MRILIFSNAYFPYVGGAEVAIKEITDRLGDEFEFHLITNRFYFSAPAQETIGKVKVFRVGLPLGNKNKFLRQFGNFLFIAFGLRKAIFLHFRHHYNMTWSMMAAYAGAVGLFFKITHPGVPWLLTLQEGDAPEYITKRIGWYKKPIWKFLFSVPDRLTAISSFLVNWAKDNGLTKPIDVIPNGVGIIKTQEHKNIKTINALKDKIGVKPDEKVVITTSRLVEKNGVEDLIGAMAELPVTSHRSPVKLLIAGGGYLEEKLKKVASDLGISDKVIFLGEVNNKDIPSYLAIADVFCRPSLSEGLGNSFLEAMLADVPIIGTPVGGIPDFLQDGTTGLFCRVNDPHDLAEKINLLLTDEALRQKIIKNSKVLITATYDWDKIVARMKEIFLKLYK